MSSAISSAYNILLEFCPILYRDAVMSQKDPNNISGLLKMHLRENNLLSEGSIQSISKALEKDIVRCSAVIISMLLTCALVTSWCSYMNLICSKASQMLTCGEKVLECNSREYTA